MKFLNRHFYLFPSLIFTILLCPFLGTLPYLDGNIELAESYDFLTGGFTKYFHNWTSVHPPVKFFITDAFFHLFGLNSLSYTLIGLIFGITGIIFIYFLTKELFGKVPAQLASIFLSLSPIYLSNSLFSQFDFLLTIFILAAFSFISKSAWFFI